MAIKFTDREMGRWMEYCISSRGLDVYAASYKICNDLIDLLDSFNITTGV